MQYLPWQKCIKKWVDSTISQGDEIQSSVEMVEVTRTDGHKIRGICIDYIEDQERSPTHHKNDPHNDQHPYHLHTWPGLITAGCLPIASIAGNVEAETIDGTGIEICYMNAWNVTSAINQ